MNPAEYICEGVLSQVGDAVERKGTALIERRSLDTLIACFSSIYQSRAGRIAAK